MAALPSWEKIRLQSLPRSVSLRVVISGGMADFGESVSDRRRRERAAVSEEQRQKAAAWAAAPQTNKRKEQLALRVRSGAVRADPQRVSRRCAHVDRGAARARRGADVCDAQVHESVSENPSSGSSHRSVSASAPLANCEPASLPSPARPPAPPHGERAQHTTGTSSSLTISRVSAHLFAWPARSLMLCGCARAPGRCSAPDPRTRHHRPPPAAIHGGPLGPRAPVAADLAVHIE
jgi:hypothetical protein